MCNYIYCYFSTCQHGELTRVTYCNKATALGLPIHDGHSPDGASADKTSDAQSDPSSSHTPTSSANNSSSSSSHTQHEHHNNMSTLNPTETRTSLNRDVAATEHDEQLRRQAALIPRSAIDEGVHSHQGNSFASANSHLDAQGYRNLNIDIPLNTQSSLSMELTHDGKVTELVARFESYAGCSDASEVSSNDHARTSILSTHSPSLSDAGTIREPPEQHVQFETDTSTIGHVVQGQRSPRKPIPSHWLPKSNGPTLATAQRAKERSHKKGSQSGSPIQVKTLRGTRSSVDMGKTNNTEGVTFLTKEALAAVESNIVSPTSPRSPSKLHRSPSKPSQQSPHASLRRSNLCQQSTLTITMSPTRPKYLSPESGTNELSRAPSSVTTSAGGNSFHTAEGSPVRSSTGSELSFRSAAEVPEDIDIPHLDLTADNVNVQAVQVLGVAKTSMLKATTEGKASTIKPKLALKIPSLDSPSHKDEKSAATATSAPSSSNTSVSPWSLTSPVQSSRIPRVAIINKTGKGCTTTRSSTLKRAQSVKSSTLQAKQQQEQSSVPPQLPLCNMPIVVSTRHAGTVNNSTTTHKLSSDSKIDTVASMCTAVVQGDLPRAQAQRDTEDKLALYPNKTRSAEHSSSGHECTSGHTSRATSTATVKTSPALVDPALMDSAIIYSRKKSDAFGTMLDSSISIPPIIVMMAHTFDLGNLHWSDSHNVSHAPALPIRGRTERYVPNVRKQSESEPSTQSSLASDLRATAPEFVPQTTQQMYSASFPTEKSAPAQSNQTSELPDLFSLDKHDVPWFYYMYPIQFAYEQGFRNGRSKSPKKSKPRKQRESVSSPTSVHNTGHNVTATATERQPVAAPPSKPPQRQPPAVLMPPPALPTHRPQEPTKQESSGPGPTMQQNRATTSGTDVPSTPFATQMEIITEQAALRNRTDSNTPRFGNLDITTIRNVGLPLGPRGMYGPFFNTVPHRGHRQGHRYSGNGLYSGRGAAGVPMHATAPFPDPVPPQGRPNQNQSSAQGGRDKDYVEYSIGKEACGMVHIGIATEQGGGEACNNCAPDR